MPKRTSLIMEFILQLDHELFRLINQDWNNIFFDTVMPFLRNKKNWIPLYIILAILLMYSYSWKKGLLAILLCVATIGMSDFLSSKVIKPTIERPRPCHENSMIKDVRLLVGCGGGYSFTSSHATNHFAIATFLGLVLLPLFRFSFPILLAWAGSISYAQVYVGVHFPLDVISGGIIGFFIGYLFFRIYIYLSDRVSTVPLA